MGFLRQFFDDLRTPLYKNALYLMTNTIIASGLGFLFWMIAARYYKPFEVGLAAAIIPAMTLIAVFSRFGFEAGLVRFLPSSGENSRMMINSCFTISVLGAILFSSVFVMGLDIWSPALLFIREDWVFLSSFILLSVVFTLFPLVNQVFVARRNARLALVGTSVSGLRLILVVIFASFFGAFGIFASWGVAILVAVVIGIFFLIPLVNVGYKPVPAVKKSVVKSMLDFSAGNYVAGIFSMLPPALVPLLIVNTLPAENVAYYYIAYTISGLLMAVVVGVGSSLFAEGSHLEKELRNNVRKALKLIFVVLVPAITVVLFFGDHLLAFFGDDYSTEGLILLQLFAISTIFFAINGVFLATRKVLKRVKPIIAIPAIHAIVIVGLSYVFLPLMGLVGIAVAFALGRGVVSLGIGVHLLRARSPAIK